MVRSSRRKWRRAPVVKSESFLIVGQASFLVCLGSKNHPRGARTPECKVGQTIAFRGLSSLTKGRLADRRQKTIVCPTWSPRQTRVSAPRPPACVRSVLHEISRAEGTSRQGRRTRLGGRRFLPPANRSVRIQNWQAKEPATPFS